MTHTKIIETLDKAISLLTSAHVATDLVWPRHDCVEELKELRNHLTTNRQTNTAKEVEDEKKRILDELWRLVEWHSEEKNQMFGLVSANTTINALHQARGIVRGDNYATASQPAPTKTDKQ